MLDELEIVKAIIGDITGVEIWGLVAWVFYKLILSCAWIALIYSLAKLAASLVEKNLESCLSKDQSIELKDRTEKAERETERVKHMYKLLKEGKYVNHSE